VGYVGIRCLDHNFRGSEYFSNNREAGVASSLRRNRPEQCGSTSAFFLTFAKLGRFLYLRQKRFKMMIQFRKTISATVLAVFSVITLTGCFVFEGDRFKEWPEYRVKRAGDENGVLIAKVKRRGDKINWPGDSYEVLVRWPSNLAVLPRDIAPADRKKEAQAFLRTLCGTDRDLYVIEESFNDRTGEVYYNLWCRPPKQT
jgi:hypothetical protein